MNYSLHRVAEMNRQRGLRHFVHGTIRRDELRAEYAATAEEAERIAEKYRTQGLRQVRITAPVDADDLIDAARTLGSARKSLIEQERDVTQQLRAAVTQMAEQGIAETVIAQAALVDRMTVRKWLGKR